jgi:hypothetical protein
MRIGLGQLYKIKERESDRCSSEQGSQTPRHILLQCPLYNDLRRIMLDKVARTDLGNTTEYDAILSHPRAARYAAAMMHQTGLLGQFRHVETEPDTDDDGYDNSGVALGGTYVLPRFQKYCIAPPRVYMDKMDVLFIKEQRLNRAIYLSTHWVISRDIQECFTLSYSTTRKSGVL